tara:strand:- start:961 stop:1728 length:768 start_codon:yes stop_codon:yes gene_type:complete
MYIHSLYSSSSGNCTRVYNDTTSILLDCGVSMKRIFSEGEFPIDAIFCSHEHTDHVAGAGVICRKLKTPIYIHKKSYEPLTEKIFKKCEDYINEFEGGQAVTIKDFRISSFSTRHDSKNGGMGYIVKEISTGKRFGYLTDTGSFTKLMKETLTDCDAYFIEAAHDIEMLKTSELYDDVLKDRIMSPFGHLSNDQTMNFIEEIVKPKFDKTQWIIFGHLSERTNTVKLVKDAFYTKFSSQNYDAVHTAPCNKLEII